MTTRLILFIGGAIGLGVCGVVLALLWCGVSGVLLVNNTNLEDLFWPSFIMLTTGWRSTPAGIMITISSVVINCLLYMAVAYVLWKILRLITVR